jgi:nucleotidyltransferase/DNA polymerase involved in DNA repair
MKKERTIALIDCQSFYASVEHAAHPEYNGMPVAIGDPERRSGIILAACPLAKSKGVSTAERIGEALAKCPELIIVRPRMEEYLRVSMQITGIYRTFTDLVEPFSIDEVFVDVTGSRTLFGSPIEIAKQIQQKVMMETGVYVRAGISSTKILAKTACDNFAKKHPEGIFVLPKEKIAEILWPLPIHQMFMVASKMTQHFMMMGIYTIGDLAKRDLGKFKQQMRAKFGKQSDIKAEYYWRIANGIDDSLVKPGNSYGVQKTIGAGRALQTHKYTQAWQVLVMISELCSIVGRRARHSGVIGHVVGLSCATMEGGFSKQMTISQPTNIDDELFENTKFIFQKNWNKQPVGRLSVDLSNLVEEGTMQLDLFEDRDKKLSMLKVMDIIKDRYGDDAIMRASSLTEAGQARERAKMIGGHYK